MTGRASSLHSQIAHQTIILNYDWQS